MIPALPAAVPVPSQRGHVVGVRRRCGLRNAPRRGFLSTLDASGTVSNCVSRRYAGLLPSMRPRTVLCVMHVPLACDLIGVQPGAAADAAP